MKILYIKLKNFSNITTCMNCNTLEIDFSKSKNKIILLEGPNGTGKTSILSTLHPFATNGNMDVRSSISPIVEKAEGYKEIHIQDDNNIYIIKHFYTPSKDSHTIKSYISKNDIELNENGNVTSFKSIINEELDLEMDFLKLIRLGANVTNFIDMKTTERKTFMGKLLDAIDIFLKYYKKVTKDLSEMKSVISHISDKLNKINVSSLDEIDNIIISLMKKIDISNVELEKMKSQESILQFRLSQLPAYTEIVSNLKEFKVKNDKLKKKFDMDNVSITQNDIDKMKESLVVMSGKLNVSSEKYKIYMEDLNKSLSNLHDLEIQLEKEEANEYIISLNEIIIDLRKYINENDDRFKNYNVNYTAEDVENVINSLYSAQNILDATYEFGKEPIEKVIKQMKKNRSVPEFISDKLSKIEDNRLQINANYVLNKLMKKMKLVYPACKENVKCGVYQAWREIINITENNSDKNNDVHDEEFYNYMSMSYNNIKNAIKELNKAKESFDKMPNIIKSMLKLDNVYNNISNLNKIYDINVLYDVLSIAKEYQIYIDKKKLLIDKEHELYILEQNSNKDNLIKNINLLKSNIDDRNNELKTLSENISNLKNDIEEYSIKLKEMESLKELMDNATEIENKLNEYTEMYNTFNDISKELSEVSSDISMMQFDINKLNNELNEFNYKKKEFKSLSKDLKKLNKKYDDLLYIRKSLSTKEGMPLYFIKIYLKNTAKITNELLDIVYDGKLNIDDFDISETEFSIPYFTKGKRLPDAVFASQGERSFISLALSFALSYQSLSRYNVMLLDEVDSTLDTNNRMKFISIIQKLMDMINGEQIFIITHNNMFDMYPVDIVSTTNSMTSNKLANYIKIKTE